MHKHLARYYDMIEPKDNIQLMVYLRKQAVLEENYIRREFEKWKKELRQEMEKIKQEIKREIVNELNIKIETGDAIKEIQSLNDEIQKLKGEKK